MGEPGPIFDWDTLRDVGPFVIPYREPVSGRLLTARLTPDVSVRLFRADDRRMYFCHGLTFGCLDAPGGPVSPFSGEDVLRILREQYDEVLPESAARAGDVLVWRDLDGGTPHSGILADARFEPGSGQLDAASLIGTKNGRRPEEVMSLGRLTGEEFEYGDSFQIYRRKMV